MEESLERPLDRIRELSEVLIGPEMMSGWLEDLPVPFLVVDERGSIVYFNQASELLFGYTRNEILSKTIETLVPESARGQHAHYRQEYSEDPQKRPMGMHLDLSARHKNGQSIPVEISLSPRMTAQGLMTSAVVWRKRGIDKADGTDREVKRK